MKVLAVREDGAQLAADPEMFYGVLVTSDGSGIIPVATALAHGDWRDGDGDASVPAHLSEMARLASAERDELDQRWQVPWPERSEKAAKDSAAFILFRAPNDDGKMRYLLQNRSDGTWGLPGGKLHGGEEPWPGALRESEEELGSLPDGISPRLTLDDDGVSTFVVDLPEMFYPSMDGKTPEESAGWAWISRKKVGKLPLNPAFEDMWDGIDWDDGDPVEKKFNPLELRDRKGRWTANGVPALILGHPKTAKHVVTYVPGVLSTTPDGHQRQIERIHALKDAADAAAKKAGKKEDTAFVLWGYRAPKSLEGGAIRNYGVATAKRLKEYQDELKAQNPDAHFTVVGHSYGSFVSGLASSRHGMKPDDLVLIGSPGVNAEHVSELAVPPDHVWVGAEPRDGVTYTSAKHGLGPNPAHPEFGARLFASEHPQKGEYMFRHAHSTYFRSQSQAIPNMAAIFTGNYDAVTPPGITPEPLPGQPGMVDDPRLIDPRSMIAPQIPYMLPGDMPALQSAALKARRIVDTNGQELLVTDDSDDSYPAAGGGGRQVPDAPHLGELSPGGTPYDQAGGEPPHWQPSQNLTAWSDGQVDGAGRAGANPWAGGTSGDIKDGSDQTHASHPEGGRDDEQGRTGVPPHNVTDLQGPGDGKWPQGGHGTQQAGTSSPGGENAIAPSSTAVVKVGPHGYVHGWIKVGPDDAAQATPEEAMSLHEYTSTASNNINDELRSSKYSSGRGFYGDFGQRLRQHASNLSSLISRQPDQPAHTIYRGVGNSSFLKSSHLRPGRVITDLGLVSASEDRNEAKKYATGESGPRRKGKSPAVLTIRVPRGVKSVRVLDHLSSLSKLPEPYNYVPGSRLADWTERNKEHVLDAGTQFKVISDTGKQEPGKIRRVVLEAQPASIQKADDSVLVIEMPSLGKDGDGAEDKVYDQLLENYPPDAIAWVRDAEWAPAPLNVAQSKIDDDAVKSWAASHQQDRVDHFVKKIEAGEHVHPAVSVREPGEYNVKVIDGHHRALAYRKLGLPLRTWLGNVKSNGGPWDETHSSQFHQGSDPANKAATLSKDAVSYRETGNVDKRCGTCVMFRKGQDHDWCTLVKGSIDAYAVCDRWYPEDEKAEKRFNPLELRDSHGRWSRGGSRASVPITFNDPKEAPKLSPETGHISGFLYPFGPPVHDKKTGRVLDDDGNVIGRQLAKGEGDSGYSIKHVPTGDVLKGPYATRQDAADALAVYHNMSVLRDYASSNGDNGHASIIDGAMKSLANGDHLNAAIEMTGLLGSHDDMSYHGGIIGQSLKKLNAPASSAEKPKAPEAPAPSGGTPWLKTGYISPVSVLMKTSPFDGRSGSTTEVTDRKTGELLGTIKTEMGLSRQGVRQQVSTVTYADGTQVYRGIGQDVKERLVSYHNERVFTARAEKDKRPVPKPEDFGPKWAYDAAKQRTEVANIVGMGTAAKDRIKNEMVAATGHQSRFVPNLVARLSYEVTPLVKKKESDPTVGLNYLDQLRIQIHPSVTTTVSGMDAFKTKQYDNDSGWWSGAEAEYTQLQQVVAHETGHAIHQQVKRMSEQDRWDLWTAVAKAARAPLPTSVEEPALDRWVSKNKFALGQAVSRYGTTDSDELQAELWSEYTMKDSPRGPAKAYGDFVMKNLKDRTTSVQYIDPSTFFR